MTSWLECRRLALEQALVLAAIPENGQVLPASRAEMAGRVDAKGIVPPYSLSLSREYDLCHDFAFLSSHNGDPTHVTAVALEEDEERGLTIRIAANRGDENKVAEAFKPMEKILEDCHQNTAALQVNRKNLLSAYSSPLAVETRETIQEIRQRCANIACTTPSESCQSKQFCDGVGEERRRIVRRDVQEIAYLFQKLEEQPELTAAELKGSHEGIVVDILTKIRDFSLRVDVTMELTPLDQDLLSLAEKLRKLSRYAIIPACLQSAARKYSIFSMVRFRTAERFNLDTAGFRRQIRSYDAICSTYDRYLKTLPNRAKVERRLRDEHTKLFGHPKVHAEIRLLLLYEQQSSRMAWKRPRVICASKSACYLCYMFFRAHGQYVLPASHGKIYSMWTLPDIGTREQLTRTLCPVFRRFNAAVTEHISACVNSAATRIPNCVNESPCGSNYLHASSTTINTVMTTAEVIGVDSGVGMNKHVPGSYQGNLVSLPDVVAEDPQDAQPNDQSLRLSNAASKSEYLPYAGHKSVQPGNVTGNITVRNPAVVLFVDLRPNGSWLQQELKPAHSTIGLRSPGFEIYLQNLTLQNTASAAQSCWVGFKLLATGGGCHGRALDVALLDDHKEVTLEDGAALVDRPIILSLGVERLVIKFSFGGAPADPLRLTDQTDSITMIGRD